jgi:hypothetical protein
VTLFVGDVLVRETTGQLHEVVELGEMTTDAEGHLITHLVIKELPDRPSSESEPEAPAPADDGGESQPDEDAK